jgi:hypothetical protein
VARDVLEHQAGRQGSGVCVVIAQLWEWGVHGQARSRPVGVCGTEQDAMAALSKALIAAGPPARGQIAQVTLVRPVQTDSVYLRQPPARTAVYDGTVIQWQ